MTINEAILLGLGKIPASGVAKLLASYKIVANKELWWVCWMNYFEQDTGVIISKEVVTAHGEAVRLTSNHILISTKKSSEWRKIPTDVERDGRSW